MLAKERQNKILEILYAKKIVKIAEIVHMFDVSNETARRDLESVQDLGIAKRVYGGAVLIDEKNGKKDHEQKEELKMASILEGFEVVELEESRGDSVMTLTATNLKFNKATAAELGFPNYIRMLVHAPSRKVAIEPCKENTKNAVPFSKDASKQTYAIVVKIPALLAAARKLADVDENSGSISFKGTLYPKEKIIIYDLSKGEPTKRRGGRQKKEVPTEVIEEAEAEAAARAAQEAEEKAKKAEEEMSAISATEQVENSLDNKDSGSASVRRNITTSDGSGTGTNTAGEEEFTPTVVMNE